MASHARASSLLAALGHRGGRHRRADRSAHPQPGQCPAGAVGAARLPGRLDRHPVRRRRRARLVAAAGQPAGSADAAHRLRHGSGPAAVVEPATALQHRPPARHGPGRTVPAHLPRVPDRAAERPGERVLVGSAYVITLGLQVVKVVLGANPDSIFSVLDNVAAGNVVEGVQLSLVAVCLLLGAVRLYRRRSGARPFPAPGRLWWSTPSVWPWSCSPPST